ncbi:MAG: tetratricopeptide repeat protein [Burkholderiales bacterium]
MKMRLLHALAIAALSASAFAMDTPKPDPKDPDKKEAVDRPLAATRAAIAREDWAAAQAAARRAVERSPGSADAHNLYAYSMRKGPHPQMDLVFRHYNEALRLEPRHRGAHEYIGEAYLMTGNLAKAKEHLAQLERLCAAGCAEQAALARGISLFERQHAKN